MFQRLSILFACIAGVFCGLGIGGAHIGGFHAGHLGRLSHAHLGGAKAGHIGKLHYGHIGGITSGHLLGAANPNAVNTELDAPQQLYYNNDVVGSPLQTAPQYMAPAISSPAWTPTQYVPENVMLAHIGTPKIIEMAGNNGPINEAHISQIENQNSMVGSPRYMSNPYNINVETTNGPHDMMGIVGAPAPYINEPDPVSYMYGPPPRNINEEFPAPNNQMNISPSYRMSAMRKAAGAPPNTNSPVLQMQMWHSPLNEHTRSSIDSEHPEFERFHPGNLYGVPSIPYQYSHRGLVIEEFPPVVHAHTGYGHGMFVHGGGHMHYGGHHHHGGHGSHGPYFDIIGSPQTKSNEQSTYSPSTAFSTNQNYAPYFVPSNLYYEPQPQLRNNRCTCGAGSIVGSTKSDSPRFSSLTSTVNNLDNTEIVGVANGSKQDTVGTKWTQLLNKPFLGKLYKKVFHQR